MSRLLARRWPWTLAGVGILIAFLASTIRFGPGSPLDARPVEAPDAIEALAQRRPNLLLILIDTLRAEHLSAYGYERPTSPFLEELAAGGIRFARHLSQSAWTKSSMASLWTGRLPARAGVLRFSDALPTSARMPAEILREAGFRTVGIFRNGWVSGYHGFDQGFDLYARPAPRPLPADLQRQNPTLSQAGSDTDAMEMASEFLRLNGGDRWFLYLHLMDVHEYTYDTESALFGTANMDIYDNAVRRTDWVIEDLVRQLAVLGQLRNSVLVIASDHGEAFGERGFEGHAREVHRESTEVPLLISLPFRLERGIVVSERSSNVDLWPTLLDLLGLPALDAADGRSRVPEILAAARREAAPEDGATAIAHLDTSWGQRVETTAPMVAIREGHFRYVQFRNPMGQIREQLFDADADARELDNRLAEEPAVAERLRGEADRYLASRPVWEGETQPLELDELQLNQLRALAYAVP